MLDAGSDDQSADRKQDNTGQRPKPGALQMPLRTAAQGIEKNRTKILCTENGRQQVAVKMVVMRNDPFNLTASQHSSSQKMLEITTTSQKGRLGIVGAQREQDQKFSTDK